MSAPTPGRALSCMRRVKLLFLSRLQKLRELCEFGENEGKDEHVHLLGPRRRAWDGWWTRTRELWPQCQGGRTEHSGGDGVGQRPPPSFLAAGSEGVQACGHHGGGGLSLKLTWPGHPGGCLGTQGIRPSSALGLMTC